MLKQYKVILKKIKTFLNREMKSKIKVATRNNSEVEMVKHARVVYWSNKLTNEIDLATIKEMDGKQVGGYYLTNNRK